MLFFCSPALGTQTQNAMFKCDLCDMSFQNFQPVFVASAGGNNDQVAQGHL